MMRAVHYDPDPRSWTQKKPKFKKLGLLGLGVKNRENYHFPQDMRQISLKKQIFWTKYGLGRLSP